MTTKTDAPEKAPYHHGDLKKALLEAAEVELIDKGVEAFSLRGVAKRAGVSHAAPAHHFKDTNTLLTALATVAAERFHAAMTDRQAKAAADPQSQFVASGLGYIDFALTNPALFKLMFGSERPATDDPELIHHSMSSFMVLVDGVAAIRGFNPFEQDEGRLDVTAAWSLVHGISNLLISGRMQFLQPLLEKDREGTLTRLVERVIPGGLARPD